MITSLTIDFWNTLFDDSGSEGRNEKRRSALRSAIEDAGLEYDDVRFDEAYHGIWGYFDHHWLNTRRTPTAGEMLEEICRRLELQLGEPALAEVTEVFARGVLDHPPGLLPGARETIVRLHARGVRMALISDTAFSPGTVLRELMEQEDVARYFSGYIFSDETGVAKPHPDAFRLALEAIGGDPERSIHIGDIERTDIKGAKEAGMFAVLYRGDTRRAKYAETETIADAVIGHWNELEGVIERLGTGKP
jgi:putative hydrolase of the HAD superfamily